MSVAGSGFAGSRIESAIYVGHIAHQRTGAHAHGFRHRIAMFLLDVDEAVALGSRLRLFGYNRRRLVSFNDQDHLGDPGRPVSANIRDFVQRSGVDAAIDRVLLLTQCRVFGYVFNPVSFYYCLDRSAVTRAIVAEVHNTFGEQHPYLLLREAGSAPDEGLEQWTPTAKKVFHVSPFFNLDGHYHFRFGPLGEHLAVRIELRHEGQVRFWSTLALERRPLSDRNLVRVLVRHPLIPHRVISGIHWEAFRVWLKGARYHPKPPYDPAAVARDGDQ